MELHHRPRLIVGSSDCWRTDPYDRVMRAFLEAAAVAEIRRRAIAEAGGWLATLAAPG